MATLGAARWLVRERPAAVEAVARQVVRHGLQRSRVERAGDPVGAVPAAVEQRAKVGGLELAVATDPGTELHQHRMTAAVAVEHLFAGQADLDRAAELHRGLGHDQLVVEHVALAAEPAAVGTGHHANPGGGNVQHLL